jgi:hypothetical protein
VEEQIFWQAGHMLRPLCRAAGVHCRGYSEPLQRRMTDFGADLAFGQVPHKLKEHYGIEVPSSAVRSITEAQARAIHAQQVETTVPAQGVPWVIVETDGTMIPLVDTAAPPRAEEEERGDRRKTRQVRWKEARLSLAHAQGSVTPRFAATLGDPATVGAQMRDCAIRVGLGHTSQVHSVGTAPCGLRLRCSSSLAPRGGIWWISTT